MKKFKLLLLIVIFSSLLAGCDKHDDPYLDDSTYLQLKSADTRSINFNMTGEYYTPLICDGATGHLVDGKFVWMIIHSKLLITSQQSGETFKINDQTKVNFDENGEITTIAFHIHARGNNNTHVNLFFEFDWKNQTLSLLKGVCPKSDDE
jgi:hypothetical protein